MHRPLLVTLSLGLSTFLALFDVTAVVVALPEIAKELRFSVSGVAWVIDAYSLAFTGALLLSGALADRYGRRRALLAGNAIFLVGSICCGLAPNGSLLIVARVLQGIGAAFLVAGASALIASTFPNRSERTKAFGILGVISGIALALGPTLGGFLASRFGWPSIFYANIPFCITLALVVPSLVSEARDPAGRPLDAWGAVLLPLSLCLAVDALLRRDASAVVRGTCFVGSAVAAGLFLVHQRRSPHPVLDPRVFATPTMAGVGALLLALQFGYWAVLVYLPLFLAAAFGVSMDEAGVSLLAATLPMLLVPPFGSRLVTHWGWRRYFGIAFGIMTVGNVLLIAAAATADAQTRLVSTFVGMVTIGIAAALVNPQTSSVTMALVPQTHVGVAAAAVMVVRQAGFVVSIAALGATISTTIVAAAFVWPWALAAIVALIGMTAAMALLPREVN